MGVANTFTFGGISTSAYGLVVEGSGDYSAPKRAVESITIPGRNGAYILDKGYYENTDVEYRVVVTSDSHGDFLDSIEAFRNAIVSLVGYQRLEDTYHPGEYRMAAYSGGLEEDPTFIGKNAVFKVKFDCKPQRWLTSGETAVTIGEWGETETATGDIVTVENEDGILGVKSLSVALDPIQDLHGYDKPWVGGGGSNKYPIEIGDDVWITNASGTTYSNNNGELIINTTASTYSGVYGGGQQKALVNQQSVAKTVSFDVKGAVGATIAVQNISVAITTSYQRKYITIPANKSASLSIYGNGTANTIYIKNLAITEDGSTDYEPYSNICPIYGRTEPETVVSPTTSAEDGTTYTTALGRTVYGGTLDVVSGELTVEYAKYVIDAFNSADGAVTNGYCVYASVSGTNRATSLINADMMKSNFFTYSPNGRANAPALSYGGNNGGLTTQMFILPSTVTSLAEANEWLANLPEPLECTFRLATPQTYQLDPQQVMLLHGTNNVWSDSGDITLEYGQLPNLLINPTLFESGPLLEVKGYGTIGFNGFEIELNNETFGDVTVLSETIDNQKSFSFTFAKGLYNLGDTIEIKKAVRKWVIVASEYYAPPAYGNHSIGDVSVSDSNLSATTTAEKIDPPGTNRGRHVYSTTFSGLTFTAGTYTTVTDTITASVDIVYWSGGAYVSITTETLAPAITIKYESLSAAEDMITFSFTNVYDLYSSAVSSTMGTSIYGPVIVHSTLSMLGNPTYIDCDIGEAYKIENDSPISLNQYIDLGPKLPTLAPGSNAITYDNTITDLKIVPRWWRV